MRRIPVLLLVLLLAACSKREPSPAAKPQDEPRRSAQNEGGATPSPGNKPPAPVAPPPAPAGTAPPEGAQLFAQNCATCHMADGGGVPFLQPSIRGSAWLSHPDPQLLLTLILRGSAVLGEAAQAYENDMAPQAHLSDAEIAALATYARQRFASPPITKPVAPAEVALARSRPGLP